MPETGPARTDATSINGHYQDECTAVCSGKDGNGYNANAAAQYTCENDPGNAWASWTADDTSLVCTPQVCAAAPPQLWSSSEDAWVAVPDTRNCQTKEGNLEGVEGHYGDSGEPDFSYTGDKCTAQCKPGYEETKESRMSGEKQYACNPDVKWVVGTQSWADGTQGPVDDGSTKAGIQCQGQVCPNDGVTPHDEPGTKSWPFDEFPECTDEAKDAPWHSGNAKHLKYSDPEKGATMCTEAQNCQCTASCRPGYSADGNVSGIQSRSFDCKQKDNAPYFDSGGNTKPGTNAQPLVCKAVSCGSINDYSDFPSDYLMSTDIAADKEHPRCGNKQAGDDADDAGTMRYDYHSDRYGEHSVRNKCTATCQEGYTAHESARSTDQGGSIQTDRSGQEFTCNVYGTYTGSLTCKVITCPDDPLRAISGTANCNNCVKDGAHVNASTWSHCSSSNYFGTKCYPKCETGFTNSFIDSTPIATDQVAPYQCMAISEGQFPNGDDKFQERGIWTYNGATPTAKSAGHRWSPSNLQCKAVVCKQLVRPRNTKYSEDDNLSGKSNYKDDNWMKGHKLCTSQGFVTNDDQIRYFMDSCEMQCLDGWYPVTGNRTVTYTCSEPGTMPSAKDEAGDDCPSTGSKNGVWCPGPCCTGFTQQQETPNIALDCKEGTLDPTQSRLLLTDTANTRADKAKPWPPPGATTHSIVDTNGPGLDQCGANGKSVEPSPFLGWRFGTSCVLTILLCSSF